MESVMRKPLDEQKAIAVRLRARFQANGVVSVNLIGPPGAGKTALLERTLQGCAPAEARIAVVTSCESDAGRLARFGFPVACVKEEGCHLDARMVESAIAGWRLDNIDLLLIENVADLGCPAYDLGEDATAVVLSVSDGETLPLSYPGVFRRASLLVVNKTDLLPGVPMQPARLRESARRVHADIEIAELSCTTGRGLDAWQRWLETFMSMRHEEGIAAAY